MEVTFKVDSASDLIKTLRAKVDAYANLFDRRPNIYVCGTFEDPLGELVFATWSSVEVTTIGYKHLYVSYRGNAEKWIPYESSVEGGFYIRLA